MRNSHELGCLIKCSKDVPDAKTSEMAVTGNGSGLCRIATQQAPMSCLLLQTCQHLQGTIRNESGRFKKLQTPRV